MSKVRNNFQLVYYHPCAPPYLLLLSISRSPHKSIMPEGPLTPLATRAIIRLYKPTKLHTLSLRVKKLNSFVANDTTCSHSIKRPTYLYHKIQNTWSTQEHCHIFRSTSKKANFNFILGIFLTFVFSLTRQFPKRAVDKYFKRLRQLLIEKFCAIRHRIASDKNNNRKTKTLSGLVTEITWFILAFT